MVEHDLIVMLGAIAGAAFALARLTLIQQRALGDRIMAQWERAGERHERIAEGLMALRGEVHDLITLLGRAAPLHLSEGADAADH